MITFKQFLNEEAEIKDLAKMIKDDCGPFLSKTKRNGMLFRGIKRLLGDYKYVHHPEPTADDDVIGYATMTPRLDRRPSDMDYHFHRKLDDWFDQHLGFKARSEGLFCYGSPGETAARSYGKVHCIFPIGDFTYAWSPEVEDLYGDLEGESYFKREEDVEQALTDWMDNLDYKKNDLDEAVSGRSEIMVKCSKYYAFPVEYARVLERALDIESWDPPKTKTIT